MHDVHVCTTGPINIQCVKSHTARGAYYILCNASMLWAFYAIYFTSLKSLFTDRESSLS